MQAQNLAVVKGLISVAWADGRVGAEENEVIEALLQAFGAMPSEAHEVRQFAATPRSLADLPLHDLGHAARRQLLQQAVFITYVDGEQHEKEKQLLENLVTLLEIPALEAKGILREAEDSAKSLLQLL